MPTRRAGVPGGSGTILGRLDADGGMHLTHQYPQAVQLVGMRLQALRDMAIQQFFHLHEPLKQLRVLLGKLLVLLPQALDAIRLLVIAQRADIGRDEEDRTCERRLKT